MKDQITTTNESPDKTPEKAPATIGEKFIDKVTREFTAAMGEDIKFTEQERVLAVNMYVMIDNAMKQAEQKRLEDSRRATQAPITWANVHMPKLALDAVHRVRLGLDALIPNHLSAIPYWTSSMGKYVLDLRIGYSGKDYYRRKFSVDPIVDIRYYLKHKTDVFEAIPKDRDNEIETYRFHITQPFNRGPVEGGFGYIIYEDASRNQLVVVDRELLDKVEAVAKASPFWNSWREQMQLKSIVIQTTNRLKVDPTKVNASYHYVEEQDDVFSNAQQAERFVLPEKTQGSPGEVSFFGQTRQDPGPDAVPVQNVEQR